MYPKAFSKSNTLEGKYESIREDEEDFSATHLPPLSNWRQYHPLRHYKLIASLVFLGGLLATVWLVRKNYLKSRELLEISELFGTSE